MATYFEFSATVPLTFTCLIVPSPLLQQLHSLQHLHSSFITTFKNGTRYLSLHIEEPNCVRMLLLLSSNAIPLLLNLFCNHNTTKSVKSTVIATSEVIG